MEGANIDDKGQALIYHINETGQDILGYEKKKNRDWFDENNSRIKPLLKHLASKS